MKLISGLTLLLALHSLTEIDAVCTEDTLVVNELDTLIVDQLIAILKGVLTVSTDCDLPEPAKVSYWLYTRNNVNNPIIITNTSDVSQIDPSKKLILIIHGWLGCPANIGLPEMKDAYLSLYDCNVLMVDWSESAHNPYTTTFCYVTPVVQIVSETLCKFSQQNNVSLSTAHIVGHSLGGQMSGLIGKGVKSICGQTLGRSSALDPAKPGYEGEPCNKRVCSTDALFVDAMHTNNITFGIAMKVGQVDFYPNGGKLQPGCLDDPISNILNLTVREAACDHFRAIDLWVEGVKSNDFKARSCRSCPTLCVPNILDTNYITMGENCPQNPPKNEYCLPTAGSSPYALGCKPYPTNCP